MKQLHLLIISLLITGFVNAQNPPSFHFTFDHSALSVKDVNRSADFYSQVMNLTEITNRTKMEGIRWFSLGENKELHLISILKKKVRINKAVHLALTTPNFYDFIGLLDKMKIPFSDWPGKIHQVNIRADGIKQIYIQDPDGYWIEVNSNIQN